VKTIIGLMTMLMLAGTLGCAENMAYADPLAPPSATEHGCVIVEDTYGEREVCDVNYYIASEGPVYWDPFFGVWIGVGGFWYGGVWHYGYYPGYWKRYHGYYHGHGFYHNYNPGTTTTH